MYLGGDEYKIRLEVLRDCFNGAPDALFDDPASIGIFDQNGDLYANILVALSAINDTLTLDSSNSICHFINVCVHRTIYERQVVLSPSPGGYILA